MEIANPILTGFHPDPSIVRAGDVFYVATSTFEWWPGVRIHASADLVHWRHAAYALTRTSQLDLRGDGDSCGVWAPDLTFREGTFYLVYSNVRSTLGAFKDVSNYVVTAPSVEGPWSEPSYLGGLGFDNALFHDDDGRSWLLAMKWDHRIGRNPFAGIFVRQYDRDARRLTGDWRRIFEGSGLGTTEGPHVYKRDAWYYLLTAEGGTFYEHAVTIARSRSLFGPYELSPFHPLLTSNGAPRDLLQRAGHGSLVETPDGEWYLAHLASRPIEWHGDDRDRAGGYETLHSPLGRETAIQRIEWTPDGWPRLAEGGNAPRWNAPAPAAARGSAEAKAPATPEPSVDDFDRPELAPDFNTLRVPADPTWCSLGDRPGFLRLYGRESLSSLHEQSLVARRLQHLRAEAETVVEFEPASFQQMAGLLAYYNTANWAYVHVTCDESAGRSLAVTWTDRAAYSEDGRQVALGDAPRVWLRVTFDVTKFRFSYALEPGAWQPIGPELPLAFLSDENATQFSGRDIALSFGFTAAYVGMACQDLTGARLHADFDWFAYRPL